VCRFAYTIVVVVVAAVAVFVYAYLVDVSAYMFADTYLAGICVLWFVVLLMSPLYGAVMVLLCALLLFLLLLLLFLLLLLLLVIAVLFIVGSYVVLHCYHVMVFLNAHGSNTVRKLCSYDPPLCTPHLLTHLNEHFPT